MHPKTLFLTMVAFVALMPLAVSAQTLWTAEFVSGAVEYQLKGTKIPLSAGSQVGEEATVFMGKGALLELTSGGRRVSLVREGTYTLRAITATTGSTTKPGIIEALGGKLRALFSGRGESGIAGVRASEVSVPTFMTGGDEAKKRGAAAMAAGNYEAAARDFEYALEETLPGEEGSVRRLLASALAMQGRQAAALGVLRGGEREDSPAVDMLEATLLLGAGAPEEALAVVRRAGTGLEPALVSELAELEGLALEVLNKPMEAASAYRHAISVAPDSPAATRAGQRLAALGY